MSAWNHSIQTHNRRSRAPQVALEHTKNGLWTASVRKEGIPPFYLHSRYDPTTEAHRFAAAQLSSIGEEKPDRIVLYGAGCGHHVKALLEQTEDIGVPFEVWETNVSAFLDMERAGMFKEIMDEPRLIFIVSDDLQVFSERMNVWEQNRVHVIVHEPSLRAIPEELESLKRVLQDYQVHQNSVIVHRDLFHDNFARNNRKEWPSVSAFHGLPSVPAIVISAGPSLSKSLALLPNAAKHCLLGSVGTAVPLLVRQGIRPDFVVMTDPQPNMLQQLDGWDSESIPLFFLSTLYSEVVDRYKGPKFILFQEGYPAAERMASLRREMLVQTGGSVSTTLFSLARILGLRPLCLVGQDLAYTGNKTHVEGTPLYQQLERQVTGERVMAFDGQGTVVAPRNLLLYKKWFEEQARSCNETFYNATEGGAYIEGFAHVTLREFLAKIQTIDVSKAREMFQRMARSSSKN
ncbi:DUF115 domain-containing protein [Paenibacillus filicis]|uniref:DUF115 domain-containing protein n=1 Tax=Paenibacillus gyeongsangnamensis TaxID=3388067 RepID=A0ABT4QDK7_9BACL|nr:6-hydroxymethylpterin diphosphokinase MptE-like protein [Paenibacillus filicis]MCZ8514881.1 DUF115 domain-containing protein [Paenibacillus filicis]